MPAYDRTDRFAVLTLDSDALAADRAAPQAWMAPEPVDVAGGHGGEGRLQRRLDELRREQPGARVRALRKGDALLASGFDRASASADRCAIEAYALLSTASPRERLLRAPVRAGLAALTALSPALFAIGTAARAIGRWREAVTSAALVAASAIICVFALFARPERTYVIEPDATPDAAPPLPSLTQPDASAIARVRVAPRR